MAGFRFPVIALAASAALLAAGCGSSSGSGSGSGSGGVSGASASAGSSTSATPSVSSLLSGMTTAFNQARSVHAAGTMATSGQTLMLDMSFTKTGEVSGTMAVGGASFYVLLTNGKAYIKVNAAFLKYVKAPAISCSLLCGKYLLASGSLKGLTDSVSWSGMLAPIMKGPGASGASITGQATVDGQQAWVLKASDGSIGYIAAQGPPYLLRLTPPAGQGTGSIDFTQWNSATIPSPPPASQVIDLSQLTG